MVVCIGPLATISREPGQARKGAAAAADSSAGVWLVQTATLSPPYFIALTSCSRISICSSSVREMATSSSSLACALWLSP